MGRCMGFGEGGKQLGFGKFGFVSFWEHCPGDAICCGDEAGNKEVSWEVSEKLGTRGLRRELY